MSETGYFNRADDSAVLPVGDGSRLMLSNNLKFTMQLAARLKARSAGLHFSALS
jgi:hypothetical protein